MGSLGVGVAGVVLELVAVHHGSLGRVDAIGNDHGGSEEGSHGTQHGRRELLEGGNSEPRHGDGYLLG